MRPSRTIQSPCTVRKIWEIVLNFFVEPLIPAYRLKSKVNPVPNLKTSSIKFKSAYFFILACTSCKFLLSNRGIWSLDFKVSSTG